MVLLGRGRRPVRRHRAARRALRRERAASAASSSRARSTAVPNGFTIRKLKDKLGTRALATGEIVFDGALAYPIGALEDGFKIAAGVVLNTSRWLNAVGSAAVMRRAYLEAAAFAREREAFGQAIVEFPLVRESLAVMRAEAEAALASSLEVTRLVDSADPDDVAYHRILVNANKFSTSAAATRAIRRGIEVLGGNGTIEDFSVLPRLWRDAIVFESWEGTHNVLCAQVARDLERFGTLELVLDRSRGVDPRASTRLLDVVARAHGPARPAALPPPARHARRAVPGGRRSCRAGAPTAELHIRRHLVPGYDPERGPGRILELIEDRAVELAH